MCSHGAFLDPQRVSHLAVGQADEIAEHDYLALATRQPPQRRSQGKAEGDGVLEVARTTLGQQRRGPAPQRVEGEVRTDAQDPCIPVPELTDVSPPSECPRTRFGGYVLGYLPVADDPVGETCGGREHTLKERVEVVLAHDLFNVWPSLSAYSADSVAHETPSSGVERSKPETAAITGGAAEQSCVGVATTKYCPVSSA